MQARSEPADAPPTGRGTRGLEPDAGQPGPVVPAERTAEGGAEEAEGQAAGSYRRRRPGAQGPSVPPQNFAAPGPRPYLQRRRRPRGRGPEELTLSARGGPARRRARTRARLGQRLGSGSARAPPPAPRLQPEGERRAGRARAVWPWQVLRLQLRGRQLPAPRPPPRGRSPARRLRGPGRSRPAAVGGPAPTRACLRRPSPAPHLGTQRQPSTYGETEARRGKGLPQGHPARRRRGQNWNLEESQGTTRPTLPLAVILQGFSKNSSYMGLWGVQMTPTSPSRHAPGLRGDGRSGLTLDLLSSFSAS